MPVATGYVRLATLEWANEVAKAARGTTGVATIEPPEDRQGRQPHAPGSVCLAHARAFSPSPRYMAYAPTSLCRDEVVPQAVGSLALDRGRSTPLDSVSSPWPPVAERPTVVGHGRGAGVPPRRMLPGRAQTYRLPGHRCQGCGPPFATNARAAEPVRRPEFRSSSPWCV